MVLVLHIFDLKILQTVQLRTQHKRNIYLNVMIKMKQHDRMHSFGSVWLIEIKQIEILKRKHSQRKIQVEKI